MKTTKKWQLATNETVFHIDLVFNHDEKNYHILNCNIPLDDEIRYELYPEMHRGEGNAVFYGFKTFKVSNQDFMGTNSEITQKIVEYLSGMGLYLREFKVLADKTYVAYATQAPRIYEKLTYSPASVVRELYIVAHVQFEHEDDMNRDLGVVFDQPMLYVTDKQLIDLGFELTEYGIDTPVIMAEELMPQELLNPQNYHGGYQIKMPN